MASPTFTPLPIPPNRETSPETFSSEADAFLGALPQFQTDGNIIAAFCETEATTATNAASSASTSETNAATSETNAATSEANAATSETNAALSAASAEDAATVLAIALG